MGERRTNSPAKLQNMFERENARRWCYEPASSRIVVKNRLKIGYATEFSKSPTEALAYIIRREAFTATRLK